MELQAFQVTQSTEPKLDTTSISDYSDPVNTKLRLKPYADQKKRWPDRGRVIVAQYDAETVVVYQAYRPSIAQAAVDQQKFGGGGYSFDRMSWIKPNFLWMMHRSKWATSPGQEHILAIWMARPAFDAMLSQAILSHFNPDLYADRAEWQQAVAASDVRVQWDPDYTPQDMRLPRSDIQIGLRNDALRKFATEQIVRIEDITEFVHQQAEFRDVTDFMLTPAEQVYPVADAQVASYLRVDKRRP